MPSHHLALLSSDQLTASWLLTSILQRKTHIWPRLTITPSEGFFFPSFWVSASDGWRLNWHFLYVVIGRLFIRISIALLWQHWIITYYYQINMLTQFPISVWSHAEFNLAVKIQGSPAVNVAVVCVCAGALFALDDFTGGLSRQHSCFFLQGGHVRSGRRHKTGAFARRVAASRRWKWGFLAEPAGDLDPRCSSLCGSRSVRLLLPLSKLHWDPQEDLITLLTCFVWMVSQCCVQFSR